ncbi:hypothetical protein [Streptomyces barkulensis]|uniref:hypothetical protein n=1 Tax=Streptomyces barkulensis TaxID=1257026 RepID=UPI00117CF3F6|nr:hypothetical protein [Streptomyces barkulensis]
MPRIRPRAPGKKTAAALTTFALISPVVAGCSDPADMGSEGDPGIPAPEVTEIQKIDNAVGLRLPIEPYLFSDAEMSLLLRAREKLIQKCMRGLGLDYTSPKQQKHVGPRTMTERRYGLADAGSAADNGYHVPGADVRPEPTLPADQYSAITGEGAGKDIPEGGCAGEAERTLSGGHPFGVSDVSQDLNSRSYRLSMRDGRVREAFRSWSSCMRAAGYEFPDPMKAMSAPEFSRPEIGEGETETAVADVRCKKETNLVGIWYTVESAYQRELIRKNAERLDPVARAKRDQLKAARKVTGDV